MFNLETLLEQIREFQNTPGITLLRKDNIFDLLAIQDADFIDPHIKNLARAIQMNLVFYLFGGSKTLNKERALEFTPHDYKVSSVRNGIYVEWWLATNVGVLRFHEWA